MAFESQKRHTERFAGLFPAWYKCTNLTPNAQHARSVAVKSEPMGLLVGKTWKFCVKAIKPCNEVSSGQGLDGDQGTREVVEFCPESPPELMDEPCLTLRFAVSGVLGRTERFCAVVAGRVEVLYQTEKKPAVAECGDD